MAIIRDMGSRGQTLNMIDPRKIEVMPGLNARDMASADTLAHVDLLADSITAQGFLGSHPLEVFTEGDGIYVSAGHCRLAAAMLVIERGVELTAIPCLSEARGTSQAQRLVNQITSNSGQRLNLAEEGRVYHRLAAMGNVISQIAKLVGRSEAHIRQAMDFNAAPAEAHALVSTGKVSATLAAKTIREEGPTKGVDKIKAAVKRAEEAGKAKATARHFEPATPARKPPYDPSDFGSDLSALDLAGELRALRKIAKDALDAWELYGHGNEMIAAMAALRDAIVLEDA